MRKFCHHFYWIYFSSFPLVLFYGGCWFFGGGGLMMTTVDALVLTGQRVLVSGAGRGIGQAIAKICHAQGAHVAICARTAEQLQQTAQSLLASGHCGTTASKSTSSAGGNDDDRVRTYTVDVTEPKEVHAMVEDIVQVWGGIDILINNAGRGQARKGKITDDDGHGNANLSSEDFMNLLNLNVVSVHTLTAAVVPHMPRKQGSLSTATDTENDHSTVVPPQIINISSKAGRVGLPGMSHYVASKFALQGLTASWATELANEGINVNAISPGMVNTTSFPKPTNRPGVRTAESIADGLLLLLQSNVTGHYLHVDDLDLIRQRNLPDATALQPINAVDLVDTLPPSSLSTPVEKEPDGQCR
jgi:NAD(P)-dependent dehydrogenase (short-subunit alcohol dehydrogenase family)